MILVFMVCRTETFGKDFQEKQRKYPENTLFCNALNREFCIVPMASSEVSADNMPVLKLGSASSDVLVSSSSEEVGNCESKAANIDGKPWLSFAASSV